MAFFAFSSFFRQVSGFVSHWMRAGNEHSVHSPFVFRLLTEAVYVKTTSSPEITAIENLRKQMLQDNQVIQVTDLGAGSTFDSRPIQRKISDIAAWFAKPPRYCKLLFRLTRFFKPGIMIELGTSLGISALYQSAGFPEGKLFTLEGCPETANAARQNFKSAGKNSIECITGNFDETLPALLKRTSHFDYLFIDGNHTYEATLNYFKLSKPFTRQDSVMIFDDINWSEGMQKAWKEITSDPDVSISIDFYQLGMVFFNKGFTKQHFQLRY